KQRENGRIFEAFRLKTLDLICLRMYNKVRWSYQGVSRNSGSVRVCTAEVRGNGGQGRFGNGRGLSVCTAEAKSDLLRNAASSGSYACTG
ncbi:MAG: hypothetical protein LBC13_02065, partial [Clostridiales bacterium]|nr:hypothetical protein [Clostridiales bacterium]